MLYDIQSWAKNCQHCKTAKDPYTDPEPPQGSMVANNPMNLLLINFMKLDPSKKWKGEYLSYDRCLLQILCSSFNTKSESKNSCKSPD